MKQLFTQNIIPFVVVVLSFFAIPLYAQQQDVLIDETFNSWTNAASIPTGWSTRVVSGSSSNTYYWKAGTTSQGRNSTRCAYGNFTVTYKSGMLISPEITPATDKILRFWMKATYIDRGQLLICTSSDAQGMNIIDTLARPMPTVAAEWQEMEVSLKSKTTQTFHIVFYVPEVSAATPLFIDDVVVENYPGCRPVVFNSIADIYRTEVTAYWTYGTGDYVPSLLNVEVVDDSTGITVFQNAAYSGATTAITVTGLQPNHSYTMTAIGNCSDNSIATPAKTGTFHFTTMANPITVPFTEGFESGMPSGWSVNPEFPDGTYLSNSATHTGSNGMAMTTTANGRQTALVTPPINHAANDMQLDFWVKPTAANKRFYVGIMDTTGNMIETLLDTTFTVSAWHNIRLTTDRQNYFTTETNCRLIFRVDATSDANTFYLDDIVVTKRPTCLRPENLVAYHANDTSMTLNWKDASTALQYEVVLHDGTTTSVVTVTSHPCTITNLTPSTSYNIKVRAICAATNTGEYSMAIQAQTTCAAATIPWTEDFEGASLSNCWSWTKIGGTTGTMTQQVTNTSATTYAHGQSGYYFKAYCLTQNNNQNYLLVSKPVNMPTAGMYDLYYSIYRNAASTYNAVTRVWVNNYPDTIGAILLNTIPYDISAAPAVESAGLYDYWNNIPLSGDVYVMFEYVGYGYMYLDHIYLEQRPTCRPVKDVHFDKSQADTSSVVVAWTKDNEDSWIVKYRLNDGITSHADSLLVTGGVPQYRISGLSTNAKYVADVKIYSYCSETEIGAPVNVSGIYARTALPHPAPLPFNEDFESFTTPELGDGNLTITPALFSDKTTVYGAASINTIASYMPSESERCLKIGNSTDHTTYVLFPEFQNQANGLRLTYSYRYFTNSTTHDTLRYGYMTAASQFVELGRHQNTLAVTTEHLTINTVPAGARFAFRYGGNANNASCAVYIDNITVIEKPACEMIDYASADSIAIYAARINAGESIDYKWEVAYGVRGTAIENCTIAQSMVGDSLIRLTGLQQDTKYDFYARYMCNDSLKSPWSMKNTFATLCAPFAISATNPFYDEMEEFGTSKIAGCYEQELSTGSYYWRRNVTATYQYNGGLSSMYTYGTQTTGMPGLYRQFHLEAGHRYQIAAAQYGYSNSYFVDGVFVYGLAGSALMRDNMTEIGRIEDVPYQTWKYEKFFLIPATTGDFYIGFYGETDYANTAYLYIDTFTVTELSCIPPVFNNLSNVTATSATLNYTNYMSACQLVVSTNENMSNIICNVINPADSTHFTITGLTPGTRYYYQMRLICSAADTSEFLPVAYFDTYCAAKPIPYSEGFESDAALICWTSLNNNGFARAANYKHSGVSSMKMSHGTVTSPELLTNSIISCEFTGHILSSQAGAQIDIGVISDPLDVTSYAGVATITVGEANTWQDFTIYFDALAEEDSSCLASKYISLVSTCDADFYFDDLSIDLAPACRRPSALVATNVTDTSVTLTWTANSNETRWVVQYGAFTDTVTSNTITINNLLGHYDYQFRVAAICGPGSMSEYSSPVVVTTLCSSRTETPWFEDFNNLTAQVNLGDGCVDMLPRNISGTSTYPYFTLNTTASYIQDGSKKNLKLVASKTDFAYYILPVMDAPLADLTLSFNYCNQSTAGAFPGLEVGLMTDPADASTYQTIEALTKRTNATAKNDGEVVINFANQTIPAGYEYAHIAFRQSKHTAVNNNAMYSSYLDNIKVMQVRSCTDPANLTISNIHSTSVHFAFTDSVNTSWQYIMAVYGKNRDNYTPVMTTSKQMDFTGLAPATDYIVYVRAYCDSANQSNWISIRFSTPEVPVALPYICDFESDNEEWRMLQNDNGNFFMVGTDSAAVHSGTHALYVSDDGANCHISSGYGTAYAYIPLEFDDARYEINFDWQATGGYSTTVFGRAYLLPSSSDIIISGSSTAPAGLKATTLPEGAIALDGGNKMSLTETWQSQINMIDMTDRAGAYKLVFYWRTINNSNIRQLPLSVDNLIVRKVACDQIDSVNVLSYLTTTNSLTVAFHNPDSLTEYRVSSSGDINTYTKTGFATSSPLVLTGLSASKNYTIFMRNKCEENDGSPWLSVSAMTSCGTVTELPLHASFETIPDNDCWTVTNLTPSIATSGWTNNTTSSQNKQGYSAKLTGSMGSASMIVSPKIHFDSLREYHVSFYMYTYQADAAYDDIVSLWLTPETGSLELATKFYERTNFDESLTSARVVKYDVDIPRGTSGDLYVAIRGDYVGTNALIFIDELEIDVHPACRELTNLPTVTFVGDNSASMTISDFHPSRQYAWAPAGGTVADTVASIVNNLSEFTITGLTPGTNYNFFARAFCNNGDTTGWVSFGNYTTKANSCFEPSKIHLISERCDTSATFTWSHGSQATQFAYTLTRMTDSTTVSDTINSDTLTLGGLSIKTQYLLDVKVVCPDSTYTSSIIFTTSPMPAATPYVCTFEDDAENGNWLFNNASKNKFIISNAPMAVKSGIKSLYVTDDAVTCNYSYNNYYAGSSFASRLLYVNEGSYEVSYDWKCNGEATTDYGRVFLLPASVNLRAWNTASSVIALDSATRRNLSSNWTSFYDMVNVDNSGFYNLVVLWHTDGTGGSNPPFAIDNISLSRVNCTSLTSVNVAPVDTYASVVFTRSSIDADIEYGLANANNPDSIATIMTIPANGQMRDTVLFTNLVPSTEYYLFARSRCSANDSSYWTVQQFTTLSDITPLPYVCSFETGEESGWTFVQNLQVNRWAIGTATSSVGSRSLYVSSTNGTTNTYDVNAASTSYVTRMFYLTPGEYEFTYDWIGYGEASTDFMRVFLADNDFAVSAGALSGVTVNALPESCVALDGGGVLNLSTEWRSRFTSVNVAEAGARKLIIMWRNDGSTGSDPSGAIDNIDFHFVTCPRIDTMVVTSVTANAATLNIIDPEASRTGYVVAYGDTENMTAATYDTITSTTLALSALEPSTRYHVWVKTLCGASNESSWYHSYFETTCQPFNDFPFFEDFESGEGFPYVCWRSTTVTPGTVSDGKWEIYQTSALSSYVSSGTHTMRLGAGGGATGDNLIALPMMNFAAGSSYDVTFNMFRTTTTNYNNTLKVWVGPNNTGTTGNVLLGTFRPDCALAPVESETGNYRYTLTIPDSIRGANYVVFEGLQGYISTTATYICLDDIRVTKIAEGQHYSDTICGVYADYTDFGFNIPAREIASGLNHFTRREMHSDSPDTLFSIDIYRFAPVATYMYDTICTGEIYNKGMFQNLTQAGTYNHVFTAVSGCDSTVYLQLAVVDIEYHIYDTICQGDSVLFDNVWRKSTGIYTSDSINSRGCTETTYFHLVVETTLIETYETICEGTSYTFHGTSYNATGIYDFNDTTPLGCPRLERLYLTVIELYPVIYDTICSGGSYLFGGQMLTTSGTYTRDYVSAGDCDVHETLHLTVAAPATTDLYDNVCEGKPYYGHGISGLMITEDTVITITGKTSELCDTLTNIHLTFIATVRTEFSANIKPGDVYHWNETDYTTAGDYTATFTATNGCDSIVTLHLTVGTAVDNVKMMDVTLVPNPVNAGKTSFIYGNFGDVKSVEILNSFGQVVDTFVPTGYPIEVQGLNASGIYYVRITTADDRIAVQKLIVK